MVRAGKWEYNPWFTIRWLEQQYSLATPVQEISRALLQHGTNKYLNYIVKQRTPGKTPGLTGLELEHLLLACTGDNRISRHRQGPGVDDPPTMIRMRPTGASCAAVPRHNVSLCNRDEVVPFPCAKCLDAGRGAQVAVIRPPDKSPIDWDRFAREGRYYDEGLHVSVSCI